MTSKALPLSSVHMQEPPLSSQVPALPSKASSAVAATPATNHVLRLRRWGLHLLLRCAMLVRPRARRASRVWGVRCGGTSPLPCCFCAGAPVPARRGRASASLAGPGHSVTATAIGTPFATSVLRSETAAGFSAEDLKRAEAQWREQGSPKGLTSYQATP